MNTTFKVYFNVKNLGLYGLIPNMQEVMQNEFVRCYNIYVDKTNGGVTEKLNKEFNRQNPNYFKENAGKEWYDLTEYNLFMANGYQRLIVDDMNETNVSPLLDFRVNPEEVNFIGMLKNDHNVTIDFYLKEV